MQIYIITFDYANDKVIRTAYHWIVNLELPSPIAFKKGSKIVSIDTAKHFNYWPKPEAGCALYLICHGGSRGICSNPNSNKEFTNPQALLEHQVVKAVYENASKVVLVSCSAAREGGLLLNKGGHLEFQAATFASNLKGVDRKKQVVAAVGPVVMNDENDEGGGMTVETSGGFEAVMTASTGGWKVIE